jgi:antitoxin component of MazEF toxin-antitoxin module
METTIIKIGNSQGLIIPKKMLKPFGENTKFDMQLKDGGLFVVPWQKISRVKIGKSNLQMQ